MKKDLNSYLQIYNNIPAELCDSIVSQISNQPWSPHAFYNAETKTQTSHHQDLEMLLGFAVQENSEVLQLVWDCLMKYLTHFEFGWFNGWSGFSQPRWNRYKTGTLMKNHCDHIHTLFEGYNKGIPVLSVVGILNDDFEGGELVMFEDTVVPCKKGDILIFPSNFLFPHRVDLVTAGTRFSFVSWAW